MPANSVLPRITNPRLPNPALKPSARTPIQKPVEKPAPSRLDFLRVARVAKVLDVSSKRVYALIAERKLESIRLGPRQIRISRESLDRYIQRLKMEEADRDY